MTFLRIENEPFRPALITSSDRMNYTDLWEMVDRFADDVLELDFDEGSYEVILADNAASAIPHLLAAITGWGAAGMINPDWPDARFDRAFMLIRKADRAARKSRRGGDWRRLPDMRAPLAELGGAVDERARTGFSLHRNAPAVAVFTSESSGEPKAAVISAGNFFSSARTVNRILDLDTRSRWLLSLPLYHVSGISIVFRCLLASAAMVLPEQGDETSDLLLRHSPTHVSLVATQLYRLLRNDETTSALARCKAVVMGGGPTPKALVHDALAQGIKLVMSYGMTETAAMICCTRPGDPFDRLLSSGKPLVDGTVSISADGEILVHGDQLFLGYLQPNGSLHRPLTEDGWFRTGDLGHFDDAGYLHISGRRDNMFISGGENIQPEEIEQALRNLDGVEETIVVPVLSAEWGRRPVAFVRMAEGRALDSTSIDRDLRETLSGYKIPRKIHSWPTDLAQTGLKPARRVFEKRANDLASDQTD